MCSSAYDFAYFHGQENGPPDDYVQDIFERERLYLDTRTAYNVRQSQSPPQGISWREYKHTACNYGICCYLPHKSHEGKTVKTCQISICWFAHLNYVCTRCGFESNFRPQHFCWHKNRVEFVDRMKVGRHTYVPYQTHSHVGTFYPTYEYLVNEAIAESCRDARRDSKRTYAHSSPHSPIYDTRDISKCFEVELHYLDNDKSYGTRMRYNMTNHITPEGYKQEACWHGVTCYCPAEEDQKYSLKPKLMPISVCRFAHLNYICTRCGFESNFRPQHYCWIDNSVRLVDKMKVGESTYVDYMRNAWIEPHYPTFMFSAESSSSSRSHRRRSRSRRHRSRSRRHRSRSHSPSYSRSRRHRSHSRRHRSRSHRRRSRSRSPSYSHSRRHRSRSRSRDAGRRLEDMTNEEFIAQCISCATHSTN